MTRPAPLAPRGAARCPVCRAAITADCVSSAHSEPERFCSVECLAWWLQDRGLAVIREFCQGCGSQKLEQLGCPNAECPLYMLEPPERRKP